MTKALKTKVLLVEDESVTRMVMADFLEDEGYHVLEAWDGDEAVRLLNEPNQFHILLTDVQMPGSQDGVDVAIHARRLYPRLPVLVVSGYAVALMNRLSVLAPAARFMPKPYKLGEVAQTLHEMASGS